VEGRRSAIRESRRIDRLAEEIEKGRLETVFQGQTLFADAVHFEPPFGRPRIGLS
jgi:hypothetical protein